MKRDFGIAPRVAIFIAGVAAGALSSLNNKARREEDPGALRDLKRSVAELNARLAAQESSNTARFGQVEAQLQEHAAKLNEMPSTKQIVDAMEQLLSRTMSSLDERLTTQAHSIEVLKTTVSQTDSLLERVLESLDTLQSYGDSPELVESPLLQRPAV
jgi:chromosome segregation ATPase